MFLKICFTLTNNVDPDEMQHYAAFHPGLHCLSKYLLGVSSMQMVKCDASSEWRCFPWETTDCVFMENKKKMAI